MGIVGGEGDDLAADLIDASVDDAAAGVPESTAPEAAGGDATAALTGDAGSAPDAQATPAGAGNPAEAETSVTPPRAGPLPQGEEPYQLTLFPDVSYTGNRAALYGNTPTAAQKASVPEGMEFDHNPPLVQHYYEGPGDGSLPGFNLTQTERVQYAASLDSGSAATPGAQRAQGGTAAQYSHQQNIQWGF